MLVISTTSWRERVNFQSDNDEVRFVLVQHAELDFNVLAHWNNSPRVDMSLHTGHIILIPVLAPTPQCHVLSGEATHTNCIVFGLTRPSLEPTIYHTRDDHTNQYTTDTEMTCSQ